MNYNDKTEVLNFDDVIIRPNKKDKKVFLLRVLPMLLIPILFVPTMLIFYNTSASIFMIAYLVLALIGSLIGRFIYIKKNK